jgi:hypothetical protein
LCVCAKGEVVAAEADGCRCQLSAWTKIDLILSTFLTSTCANLTRQFLCHQEHVFHGYCSEVLTNCYTRQLFYLLIYF